LIFAPADRRLTDPPKLLAEMALPAVPQVGDWIELPTPQKRYGVRRVQWVTDGQQLDHVVVVLGIPVVG
jgi:hypothetical protein